MRSHDETGEARRSVVLVRAAAAAAIAVAAVTMGSGGGAGMASAAPALHPGDMIRLALVEYGCTVGLTGYVHGAPVAVTAGHCAPAGAHTAYRGTQLVPIGQVELVTAMQDLDMAVVSLRDRVARTSVASPGQVGDIVCKTGRITGRTCGPILSVTSAGVVAKVRLLPGDSGGPLRDRRGRVIGITSSLNADPATTTAVEAWTAAATGPVDARFVRADRIVSRIGLE